MNRSDRPPLPERPEDAHSPLPWRVAARHGYVEDIIDSNGEHAVCCGHGDDYGGIAGKDAAFIVAAVNAHAALLAALREMVRAWDSTMLPVSARMDSALADADAAIAKAEGR